MHVLYDYPLLIICLRCLFQATQSPLLYLNSRGGTPIKRVHVCAAQQGREFEATD